MKDKSFSYHLNKNTNSAFSFRDFIAETKKEGKQLLAQNYELIKTIKDYPGKSTYLARDLTTSNKVIIKSFNFGTKENQWLSFNQIENEIKTLRSLNHPQIPKYLNSFESNNNYYLVQEFIDGEVLSTSRSYSEKEIIELATQLLSILVYLSQKNPPVVHHDIKPNNILIDNSGKVFLIDFGIAKEIVEETIGITTQFGGTEGFIAPEKILGRKCDIRSDLYSLGVTIACLITRTSSSQAVLSLLNEDFELKRGILDCSNHLSHWVNKLVRRKPQSRFKDVATALKELDKIKNIRTEIQKKSINKVSKDYLFINIVSSALDLSIPFFAFKIALIARPLIVSYSIFSLKNLLIISESFSFSPVVILFISLVSPLFLFIYSLGIFTISSLIMFGVFNLLKQKIEQARFFLFYPILLIVSIMLPELCLRLFLVSLCVSTSLPMSPELIRLNSCFNLFFL